MVLDDRKFHSTPTDRKTTSAVMSHDAGSAPELAATSDEIAETSSSASQKHTTNSVSHSGIFWEAG
jgi:hypothetical protein